MSMRLFVFDVDGTIIDYDQNIKSETMESINNLLRKHDNDEMVTREMDEAFKVYGESDVTSFYRTVDWEYMKNIYGLTRNNIDKLQFFNINLLTLYKFINQS